MGRKALGGFVLQFQLRLCWQKELLEENVSWRWSRPASVRWVILCGSSGCSQSKPPASSCGHHRSNGGWKEGKNRGRLNSFWAVTCVFLFEVFFGFVYLNLSLLDSLLPPRWLDLSFWGFQGIINSWFRQHVEILFKTKWIISKLCSFTTLKLV